MQADIASFFMRTIIPVFLTWLAAGIILYMLLLGFKGSSARGTFGSVMASLSVFSLVYFVGTLIMSLLFFFAVPQFFQARGISQTEVAAISYAIASNPQFIHWAVLAAGLVIGLAIIASYFYIVAKIGKMAKDTGAFSDCVLAVVSATLSFIAFTLLISAFSGL